MKSSRIFSKLNYFLLTTVLIGTFIFSAPPANAQFGIVQDLWAGIRANLKILWDKSGSVIFQNTLRTAINQMAYDYATELGSGAPGQKPMFSLKDLSSRITDASDAALGQVLEQIAQPATIQDHNGKTMKVSVNLCQPDLNVLRRITLGIGDVSRPTYKPGLCDYKTLVGNWKSEFDMYSSMSSKDWLTKLSSSLDPGANDLSISWELMGLADEKKIIEAERVKGNSAENGSWISPSQLISKKATGEPGATQAKGQTVRDVMQQALGQKTGDIIVDAANIFINQLAISAFNKLMGKIGTLSDNSDSSSVSNQYAQGGTGGVTEVNRGISQVLQAQVGERSDYNVLSQFITCTNEANPGPTNCVINNNFAKAIEGQMTVAKAIEQGLLDSNKRLGYDERGDDLSYNDGYPYRSLIILRKYRVLPVGWEVAAQYIKKHPQDTSDVTLKNLLECFSKDDQIYKGYGEKTDGSEDWCHGLVDPNWVLKIPKLYCGMEGYGPEILNASVTPSNTGYCTADGNVDCSSQPPTGKCLTNFVSCTDDNVCSGLTSTPKCNFTVGREVTITRNNGYCADEQSCIKENGNGSCATYGYCTEEDRRWNFYQQKDNSCEARNNTCQTYKSDTGVVASYLENTLDYGNCGANQVGCKQYATTGSYNPGSETVTEKMTWSTSTDARYFNKNISSCDASQEGCHQFIRIKDNFDSNLIADGSFEASSCSIGPGISKTSPLDNKSNSLVKTASAQAIVGSCQLEDVVSPGALLNPDKRWYIRVSSGAVKAGISNDQSSNSSGQSLYVEGAGGIYSRANIAPSILPAGFTFEDDRFYTLNAMIYVVDGKARIGFGSGTTGQSAETTTTGSWQSISVIYYRPVNGATDFYIEGVDSSAKFYIDEIKLTVGAALTSYSDYLANNVTYEKLLPAYLEASCYVAVGSNYQLKDGAPEQCKKYARKCNANEVGCEKYISTVTGIDITGKVKPKDICPSSCIGYDVFVEQPTYFSARNSAYFIPATANTCSSQAVGCTAFTNLDKLDQGGEATEYYSYLRTCMKPDVASCGEFYTWEGSDESGYQLKVFSLKKNPTNANDPASTMSAADEALVCNEDIFKKGTEDPGYNYDCREFYGRDGSVSYHLYTRTISCSEDCHPYRREVASAAECTAGNGTWDSTQSRCLYYSIPGDGTTCAAAEVGCHEYTGNIANNVRIVNNKIYDFENSAEPTDGWDGGTSSSTSLQLGEHSLSGTSMSKLVGKYDPQASTDGVTQDESYTISFLAKSGSGNDVYIRDINLTNANPTPESAAFSTNGAKVGADWKIFTFNLDRLNHEVSPINIGGAGQGSNVPTGEKLNIIFDAGVYIDNITLTEIPDRYFLIKNSWTTPDECDQTFNGDYALRYMLGCSQYKDSNDASVNLHSFSQLCQDSAAGCEQMIDTKNSSYYQEKAYNDDNKNGSCDTGEVSCVKVPADEIINVAYDKTKLCKEETKGCQRLGLTTTYEKENNPPNPPVYETSFADVYKNNNPDSYNTIICGANSVGCSAWTNNSGATTYFKDPGNMACEWRVGSGSRSGEYAWYKKKVKRCDGVTSGALCNSDSDCSSNKVCKLDDTDSVCDVTSDKTVGRGGSGNRTDQPSTWAGVCDAVQAGCTEYVDPTSKFNVNLILNPDYKDLDNDPAHTIEYWTSYSDSEVIDGAKIPIVISPQTVYILKGAGDANSGKAKVKISCTGSGADKLRVLDNKNQFSIISGYQTPLVDGGATDSLEFYFQRDDATPVTCNIIRDKKVSGDSVYLRQAIVEYQLAQNLDRTSPNGLVNIDAGFILFNERAQEGASKKSLVYNADKTFDTPLDGLSPGTTAPLNANVILKVKPDRTCAKWLSCLTYVPDPSNPNKKICLDMGLCDKLGLDGNCANFVSNVARKNQTNNSTISNLSGYSKVGYVDGSSSLAMADYYNIAAMSQVGEKIDIANSSFEVSNSWDLGGSGARIVNQPNEIAALKLTPFSPIKDPNTSRSASGSGYLAPDGRGLLKLAQSTSATQASTITLTPNRRYTITFYSYSKGNGLSLMLEDQTGTSNIYVAPTFGDKEPKNQWVKHTFGFKPTIDPAVYKISFATTAAGEANIDDVRIDPGLNTRCSSSTANGTCNDPIVSGHCSVHTGTSCTYDSSCPSEETCVVNRPDYIGSSCRLYARDNSLACAYSDKENIYHQGIYGYCLEADPKDPSACLLWYPVNRIAGDQDEEGSSVSFNNDNIYYCAEAADQCTSDPITAPPQLYCKTLVQVDTSAYWNTRLKSGSTFKASANDFFNSSIFYPTMTINFGAANDYNNNGTHTWGKTTIDKFTLGTASGPYGAIRKTAINVNDKEIVGLNSGNISNFVPLWFPDYIYNSGGNWSSINKDARPSNNRYICYSAAGAQMLSGNSATLNGANGLMAVDSAYVFNTSVVRTDHSTNCDNVHCEPSGDGWNWDDNDGCNQSYCSGQECFTYFKYSATNGRDVCDSNSTTNTYAWVTQNPTDEFPTINSNCNSKDCRAFFNTAYNIKQFNVVKGANSSEGINNAKEFVKRLFPATTSCLGGSCDFKWNQYTWNTGTNKYDGPTLISDNSMKMSECANGVRPSSYTPGGTNNSGLDYCYIKPKIANFNINGLASDRIIKGSGIATLSFNTQTDPEQLPLKTIVIDWGYKDTENIEQITTLSGNLADLSPRVINRWFDYYLVNNQINRTLGVCTNNDTCELIPTITITDNWGYFSTINTTSPKIKIIVQKPRN